MREEADDPRITYAERNGVTDKMIFGRTGRESKEYQTGIFQKRGAWNAGAYRQTAVCGSVVSCGQVGKTGGQTAKN